MEKRTIYGKESIRTSLIVAALIIVAAAIVAGPCLAPSCCRDPKVSKTDKVGTLWRDERASRHGRRSCRRGVEMWVDEINRKEDFSGERLNSFQRDTGGKPEEAVRWAREFAADGDIDFLYAHGWSAEAFLSPRFRRSSRRSFFSVSWLRSLRGIQKSEVLTASGQPAITSLIISWQPSMRQRKQRNSVLNGGTR